MKPMLAEDWSEAKQAYPAIAQPKVDGVRALNTGGALTGRSLKSFKNRHVTAFFSRPELAGMDGEMVAANPTHPDLCRLTTSALGTIEGEPWIEWYLFDLIDEHTARWPYWQRLDALRQRLDWIAQVDPELRRRLHLIESVVVPDAETLTHYDLAWRRLGYEGTIIRDPYGLHKQGRSTVKEGGLLRVKLFIDFEFRVEEILEGSENLNEAQTNELGKTFRSSHQENKVPNGLIGSMIGRAIEGVKHEGKVLLWAGQQVKVSAGRLTHDDRRRFFLDQEAFKALIHKAQMFPHGHKDAPRFPTWQSSRMEEDMSS